MKQIHNPISFSIDNHKVETDLIADFIQRKFSQPLTVEEATDRYTDELIALIRPYFKKDQNSEQKKS